jgi:predicted ArsR family transcriptional regulator
MWSRRVANGSGQLLEQHRYLPVKELCRRLGVSEATARRDLAALVHEKKITRTTVAPCMSLMIDFRHLESGRNRARAKGKSPRWHSPVLSRT